MKSVKGEIIINEDGTVTIKLENGSRCSGFFSNGVKSFIDIEVEEMEIKTKKEQEGHHLEY